MSINHSCCSCDSNVFFVEYIFSYSKETYFREETISDNLPITFGSVVGVLVLEQLFAKESNGKSHKTGKKTELIIV